MSKPFSFGLAKTKPGTTTKPTGPSLPISRPPASKRALHHQQDSDDDEEEPKHESVTGFSSSGAILTKPIQEKTERIIHNPGNADWRKRGQPSSSQNLLPPEVQKQKGAQRNGDVVMVERDEVSQASGLQFATTNGDTDLDANHKTTKDNPPLVPFESSKPLGADEAALQALLDDGTARSRSTAVIEAAQNQNLTSRNETDDFRADVAARPDMSTLDEYAAMPVEEFGMALLRGMGQKRRANGEIIKLDRDEKEDKTNPRKVRKQEGFLGIGAKPAPGTDFEIGAWGKADMRKNNRGQGFFTPVVLENKATGERITEEELQKRLKESKEGGAKGEEDWRERRDRNLEKSGRDKLRNGRSDDDFSDKSGRRERGDQDSRHDSSRKRENGDRDRDRDKDRDRDRDYDGSRSRRDKDDYRDQDRDRPSSRDDRSRTKDSDRRHHHRQYDDDRYDSASSHRSGHRERDRDKDRDRDRDRDKYSESHSRHRDRR